MSRCQAESPALFQLLGEAVSSIPLSGVPWEPREEAESPCAVPLAGWCCWRDDAHSHLTHILFLAQPAAGS